MYALFARIIPVFITVLSGVGVSKVLDKVAADKIPNYVNPYTDEEGINWKRVIWTAITVAVGTILAAFIVRKLRLKLKV